MYDENEEVRQLRQSRRRWMEIAKQNAETANEYRLIVERQHARIHDLKRKLAVNAAEFYRRVGLAVELMGSDPSKN